MPSAPLPEEGRHATLLPVRRPPSEHYIAPKAYHMLVPYVCLNCRSTFKRPGDHDQNTCPKCGSTCHRFDVRFRPPPKRDNAQWKKIEFLFGNGIRFQKVYRRDGPALVRVGYPKDMREARAFVEKYRTGEFVVFD